MLIHNHGNKIYFHEFLSVVKINNVSLSEYLKTQLSNFFFESTSFAGIEWSKNIYSSIDFDYPAVDLDCMNQCFNIAAGVCDFFVFLGTTCYLGGASVSNGTVVQPANVNVTIHSLICKSFLIFFAKKISN